jgi:hypothetical protein
MKATQPELRTWPPLMREPMAAAYLTDEKGLPTTAKTLRNQRHQRRGPKCQYYGAMVLYRKAVLDDYAENEALQPESPAARTRRLAREATRRTQSSELAGADQP